MYKAVIFDFDGTICDTGEGIMKSAKYALEKSNIPCGEWSSLTYFIGPPLFVTFQEKFGASAPEAEELVKKFRQRYSEVGLFESKLYDGVKELISNLKKNGLKIGLASSKPQKYVETLLTKYSLISYFDSICAVSFQADCESKENIISRCLKDLDLKSNEVVVVGDTKYDIDGARANRIDGVGVMWGYGNKFEFIEAGAKFIAQKMQDVESVAYGIFEQQERQEKIYEGKIISLFNDEVQLINGKISRREYVTHPGGVGVIGLTDDDEVILVRQHRYAYRETILEIPAGKVEKGETDSLEVAKREFREEAGAIAEKYVF